MSFLSKEITLPRLRAPKLAAARPPATRGRAPQLRLPSRSAGTVTGLDLGATQVIAAQAHLADGRVVADRVVSHPLAPGLVRDGLVLNVEGLAGELRALFNQHGFSKRVRVGLATPRTVLRVIDVPPIEEADVAAVLPMLAQEAIPMPLEGAVLDHQTVGLVDTPEGRRLRVIVVAAERAGIETLVETLERAGLRAAGIDLSVFGVIRAVAGHDVAPHPVLYAQLGDLVNVAIAEGGLCRFTRQSPQGLGLILARLADQRDITFDAAKTLLATAAGEPGQVGEDLTEAEADPADVREVATVLSRVASELASELRASAEFYGSQFGTVVSDVVVTGPLTTLRGFVDAVADASGMTLRCGEVTASSEGVLAGVDPRVAPVAVGLSVATVAP